MTDTTPQTSENRADAVPVDSLQTPARVATSSVETLKKWYREYRANHGTAPVEDINQLSARLELASAHPSGIAQLLSNGHAHLDSLYRDSGMLKATERKLARVLDDKANKEHNEGTAHLSLSVGVASWPGRFMPVILYPVRVESTEVDSLAHADIRITGPGTVNESLVNVLHDLGMHVDVPELMARASSDGVSLESAVVFSYLKNLVGTRIEKFSIENTMILGCFIRSSTLMLSDADYVISSLESGATGNDLIDVFADEIDPSEESDSTVRLNVARAARERLRSAKLPEYRAFDGDPHDEVEVGDVDNVTRYVARAVTEGTSVFMNLPVAYDSVRQAAAIASHAALAGKSVLYAPGVSEQKRNFLLTMRDHHLDGFVIDLADAHGGTAIDRQLISAVSFHPGTAQSTFNQLADELVGVRGRLTKYLKDLHGRNDQWHVSAYETIENLARISALPSHPSTHVRLTPDIVRALEGHEAQWGEKLVRAGQLGEYTITEADTPWFKASLYTKDEALSAYQRVERLLDTLLPTTAQQITSTAQTCGFPVPVSAREWNKQVHVLRNLRKVLDVFQPAIFERDINAMIEATADKQTRKESNSSMGFWERRRHVKEAKSLLRAGAQPASLHDALVIVRRQAELWREFVPRGGWPVLPPRLDDIIETQEGLERDLTSLSHVLERTPLGGELSSMEFEKLEKGLRALYNDRKALEDLPERASLEVEFSNAGLDELIADLRARRVAPEAAPDELTLAWWTTVFESIVKSSPIISNQDGSVLSTATERFIHIDTEHVRSIGPLVSEELMKRLSEIVYAHSQDANAAHSTLTLQPALRYSTAASMYPSIVKAAKPIIVGMPVAVASETQAGTQLADIAIIDACAHIQPLELLSILSRVKTAVVLAHEETVSSPSVKTLMSYLPRVEATPRLNQRDSRLSSFLVEAGFGTLPLGVTPARVNNAVTLTTFAANGVATAGSGLVETSRQEIDRVCGIITARCAEVMERGQVNADQTGSGQVNSGQENSAQANAGHANTGHRRIPRGYKLTVVCLNDTHRQRVGAELKRMAGADPQLMKFLHHVAVVAIQDVAGMDSTDVILTIGYAKTTQGRLIQQFGAIENPDGEGMLLDALALAHAKLDIVSSFTAEDMEDERLHQRGPQLLKQLLNWAAHLEGSAAVAKEHPQDSDILLNDLAARMRSRGLNVAVNYGFENGQQIPLAVGLPHQPYMLAVCTDDKNFMSIASTRQRHRFAVEDLQVLGWTVMYVWSVAAFVNPEKEVDRIVAYLTRLKDDQTHQVQSTDTLLTKAQGGTQVRESLEAQGSQQAQGPQQAQD
ncbi:helicase [Alloscardovia macacae]|uniref:helicase n=1 Tax=Alloscardovia macacae TaxID=1160091 RepID=UPI00214DD200|nr:helicase [Alloscardovia macacae]